MALRDNIRNWLGIKQAKPEPKKNLVPFANIRGFNAYRSDMDRTAELEQYKGWVYVAASRIATEMSGIHLTLNKITKKGTENEVEEIHDHPLLDLMDRVNPFVTYEDLTEITQINIELTGEAFWWLIKDNNNEIVEIYPYFRPDRVSVVPSATKFIGGYIYHVPGTSEKIPFDVDEIIHFKTANPIDPYRGFSPVKAAEIQIVTDNKALQYNHNFFENSARPDGVLEFNDGLTEEQVKQVRTQWENSHGKGHEHKVAILSNGKYNPITFSQKDMEFLSLRKFNRDEILSIFKVPKAVIDPQETNFAVAQTALKVFIEQVIQPKMRKYVGTLNEFLIPQFGDDSLFFDFVSPLDDNPEIILKRYEVLSKVGAITPNEIRMQEGLPPIAGGDEIRPQQGESLVGLSAALPKKKHNVRIKHRSIVSELTAALEKKLKQSAAEGKKRIPKITREEFDEMQWKNKVQKTDKQENEMIGMLVEEFNAQERRVLASLNEKQANYTFDEEGEENKWRERFEKFVRGVVILFGIDALRQVGQDVDFDINERTRKWIDSEGLQFAKDVNVTTAEKIKKAVIEGTQVGEGIPKIRKRIQGVFKEATTSRANNIARTEVAKEAGFSTIEGWKQSGVVKAKRWATAQDERVCPICAPLHNEIISIDKSFNPKYPTDHNNFGSIQSPPAHQQCRCATSPITLSQRELAADLKKKKDELEAEVKKAKGDTEKELVEIRAIKEKLKKIVDEEA